MYLKEQDIITGLRQGDKTLFDYLFRSLYSGLCTYANSYLKSGEDSEEIVQEVFIKLWENHDKIEIHTSLKAYLYRSVHNACLNQLRINKSSREKIIDIDLTNIQSELLSDENPETVFAGLFNEQAEKELENAIADLPEQCREIFILCRYENLSYHEISVKRQVSLSTVKTQMSRAMLKLSERMEKYF